MSVEEQVHHAAAQAVAPGCRIVSAEPYRRHPSPFPAKLELQTASGPLVCVVKTATPASSRLDVEAAALTVMAQVGAAAPRLLVPPSVTETDDGQVGFLIMTPVSGRPLPWLAVDDVAEADRTCRLLLQAVKELHALTDQVVGLPAAQTIPRRTLDRELAEVVSRGNTSDQAALFDRAVDLLDRHLADHRLPLVFSNGDYNPLNVLADDDGLTGWIDFELAAFEDPLIGLPKFLFWADDSGWALGGQVGLVQRHLFDHRVSPEAFAVRVLLRGLTHLDDVNPYRQPTVMIECMEHAVVTLQRASRAR